MDTRNIIELNGKHYDALTGKPVKTAVKAGLSAFKASAPGKIISDFTRAPRQATTATKVHAAKSKPSKVLHRPAKPSANPSAKPTHAKPTRSGSAPHHIKAHHQERAKTLLRSAVRKPNPVKKPKAIAPVHAAADSVFALTLPGRAAKPSKRIDPGRLERARTATTSHLVKHFNRQVPESPKPVIQPIAVKPVHASTAKATATDAVYTDISPRKRYEARALRQAITTAEVAQPLPLRRRQIANRPAIIASIVVLVVLIGGFFVVQNLPRIDVRLASMHAGFNAKLPNYQPSGFSLIDHVQASTGHVILNYQANTDDRNFSVSQQTSNWDTATLQDFVKSTNETMQAWQEQGQTFYKYGNHLVWVSGGIWYQITDHAELSNQQLLHIATSM